MAGTGSGQRAYIGSFTSAGGKGVTTAAVDPGSGALSVLGHTDAVADPSYLAVAPGAGVLYAVSETADGRAAAFSLADPARPVLLEDPVPVGGDSPTHLTVAAGQLFTANYGSGSVSALPVRPDGTLHAARRTLQQHQGAGPDGSRQEGPHAHAVVADAGWRWLLAVDLGTDSVWTYRLDHAGAAPGPHREASLRPGSGPRHLAFHPGGDRAYVVGELDSTLTACRWDSETGTLEPVGETSTRPARARGDNYPSALVLSADGRFAWVANRGDDTIAVLALGDGADTELLTTVDCGGHWPRDLAVDPAGRRLYAANERSGDVTWFTVDPATGTPHRGGTVPVPAPTCVVFA
ncbi:lactonase family protein [Streptomyces sp. TRM 70351]|uniref:lactonase family protein n=1 Tax=Streptomyces sp. TRM 70351 TaxID=3116552 RepID=UPI002E7AD0E0|nr:lactonase family protein [Streptomyces sp. TRM 70351]MEE1927234.1 lactonase family protein [Streptomyces sp. TRM 70351]